MKRIAFIGQAPAKPRSKHEVAGAYLRPWLYKIGIGETNIVEYCQFYALMASFPDSAKSGHLRPTAQQIIDHQPFLIKSLQLFRPEISVPVGSMAIKELLQDSFDATDAG